jgi:hypothetical protein
MVAEEEEISPHRSSIKTVARINEKLVCSKNFARGSSEGYAAILSQSLKLSPNSG